MTIRQLITRVALVLLLAAIAGTVAYLISDRKPRVYAATTKLLFSGSTPELRAVGVVESADEEERAIVNNVALVGSYDIARRTAEELDDPRYTAEVIASQVSSGADRGSDIVTIAVRSSSAEQASDLAFAYRRQFILRQQEVVRDRARKAARAVRQVLRRLTPLTRRGPRGESLRNQLAALQVLQRVGGEPLVVEGVRASAGPISPNVTRDTLFGLLFGAVLGIGLVALRGATSPSRRLTSDDVPASTSPPPDQDDVTRELEVQGPR